MDTTPYILHEDRPRYDSWFRLLIASIILITLVPGIILYSSEPAGSLAMLGATLFDALLFHAVTPRRFQLYTNRLRIVLGWPFAINLSLWTISEARAATGSEAFAYWGVRFATSIHSPVEIIRNRGLNFVISPSDRTTFIEQLNAAISRSYNNHPVSR